MALKGWLYVGGNSSGKSHLKRGKHRNSSIQSVNSFYFEEKNNWLQRLVFMKKTEWKVQLIAVIVLEIRTRMVIL